MEYQEELKRLQEGSNYWKPKVGQFKVKSLTELEPTDPYVRRTKDAEGKEIYRLHQHEQTGHVNVREEGARLSHRTTG